MAMKKRFYTMNSQMMAYDEGGVTKDFLTDHLGSITAEISQSQTRTYDTRYSAYGRNNWSTGTGCGFGWVGTFGYRETGLFHMSHYVRARHYSYITGNWSTVDPLWPREASYGYVGGRVGCYIDRSGADAERIPIIREIPKLIIVEGGASGAPGGAAGIGAGAAATGACAIVVIGWSCYEICTYKVGKPSGPLTRCGQSLADWLFPLTEKVTVTPVRCARSPKSPIIKPGHPNYPKVLPKPNPNPTKNGKKCPNKCPVEVRLDTDPLGVGHYGKWPNGTGVCYGLHTHFVYSVALPPTCKCVPSHTTEGECFGRFVPGPRP